MNDVKQMCARLVLAHHLKKTIAPSVLEVFRANRMLLVAAVAPATEASVVLEVPLPAADANNVVLRQDMLIKTGWMETFSGAGGDKKTKRGAPMAVAAEVAAATKFNTKKTRVQGPQRADTAGRGGGARSAFNAGPRPLNTGTSQRPPPHQQQGGSGGPATVRTPMGCHTSASTMGSRHGFSACR